MLELARRGLADLGAAFKLRDIWWALASEDIADSHRRTMLGPIWPLLNYLLFVGTLVLVLGRGESPNFVAYVSTGMLVWLFISDVLTMSANLFSREEGFIKGTVLPISIYVMRQTLVISIRSFYALLGAVAILLYSGFAVTPALLSVLPAVFVLLLAAPAVAVLFGIAGAFFRDFQFIVVNATRLLMFITPIFWTDPGAGGLLGFLYYWNPLTHYIDIIRMPIVDGTIPTNSWTVALSVTALLLASALIALGKFNRRIVFQL